MILTALLMFIQAATPHVNPSATPVPDSVTDPVSWTLIFFAVVVVAIAAAMGYFFAKGRKTSVNGG